MRGAERRDDPAHDPQRVAVVVGQMVGDAGDLGVQVAAAELLGGHHLAGGGLHQRRAAEEDGALVADDDGFVAHRGHIRTACGARAEHRGDLRNALGAHGRLVVEDAAEVFAVGEHLVLPRQERAAGVDQVDARQPVLRRDLLCAQMLLDRDRVVRAALDRRVVGHDHAFAAGHPADAGDHPGAGAFVVVHAVGGQRRRARGSGLPGSSSPSTRSRGSNLPRLTWRSRARWRNRRARRWPACRAAVRPARGAASRCDAARCHRCRPVSS